MPANNLMLMTARSRVPAEPPTYLMQRRHFLPPSLATSINGAQAWTGNGALFTGGKVLSGNTNGNYLQFANLPFAPGTWEHRILFERSTNRGIVDGRIGAADLSEIDLAGATAANTLATDSFTVGAKALDYFRQVVDGTNNSFYYQPPQLMELVKTSDGDDWGGGPEDLPWYQDIPPWFHSAKTGPGTWHDNTSSPFGGTIRIADANSEYTEYLIFCPATATYQLAVMHTKLASGAILDATVDGGSSLGTVDTHSGSTTYGNTATISLGTLSAGWHTVRLAANGRNGSNTTGYNIYVAWLQLQRTSTGTGAAGVNGPEQVLLLPTFSDIEVGTWALGASGANSLYGYYYGGTGSTSKSWSVNLRSGTYRARISCLRASNGATNTNLNVGASTEASFSMNGATQYNHIVTLTGISIPSDGKHVIKLEKTAGDYLYLSSLILERTGD